MIWVNIIAVLILIFSVIGGLKEGAVRQFFNIVVLIIAIPLAGISYGLIAGLLSFLPGENWESFIGFFITFAILSAIGHLVVFMPRRIIGKLWRRGAIFRVVGGALNAVNASIGMVVFTLVLLAYPIFDWLERAVAGSSVLASLVQTFGFVQNMLPAVFQIPPMVV